MRFVSLPAVLLAFAACGDNLPPDADEEIGAVETEEEQPDHHEEEPPPAARPLSIAMDIGSPRCDESIASYEAIVKYADDNSFVPNFACRFTFDDGTTSDSCSGEKLFADAGNHDFKLEVTDLDTGATAVLEQERFVAVPLVVDFQAGAPACGLEITFASSVSVNAERTVTITPGDQVVGGGLFIGGNGTARVILSGEYALTLDVEEERPNGPICTWSGTRFVTVTACPGEHEHPPDPHCPH